MTSGMGPGGRTGEFRGQVRGSGSGGRSLRTGSALPLIGLASLALTVLSFVLWLFVSRERDGLLLLTTIFAVVFIWAIGAFSRKFWSA